MKLKNKIKQIVKAWKNVIIEDEVLEELFQQRLDMCKTCPYNMYGVCTSCGCPIVAKCRSNSMEEGEVEECPINKWNPVKREDDQGTYILRNELPNNLQKYFENDIIEYEIWKEFLSNVGSKI